MPILYPHLTIAYTPIPKIASTAIKNTLYEHAFGHPYEPIRSVRGQSLDIHDLFPTAHHATHSYERLQEYTVMTVVRDPIKRLIAAYRQGVVDLGLLSTETLSAATLQAAGLVPDPDLSTFIQNLSAYRALSSKIYRDTDPQVSYIGATTALFDCIVPLEHLDDFTPILSQRSGRLVAFDRRSPSRSQVDVRDLSLDDITRLADFYRADYTLLRDHYSVAAILTEHASRGERRVNTRLVAA